MSEVYLGVKVEEEEDEREEREDVESERERESGEAVEEAWDVEGRDNSGVGDFERGFGCFGRREGRGREVVVPSP